ncbi:MAG: homoserine dehydrogenase [Fimbriimonadaceae bacterium]|nr:homoserine dehydrogenase [Fimbriimonadaceae bacterium]
MANLSNPVMSSSALVEPRPLRVGLLGFGTVGEGTYRMLLDNAESVAAKAGIPLVVQRVGVRDTQKPRSAPSGLFTSDLQSVVDDPEVDIVVEVIGGIDPAVALVERALANKKPVVTANKEMIAKVGHRLVNQAHKNGLDLHFEAAVGGGIPVIQALKHQLAGNDVPRMLGILNGTSNYILTKMSETGAPFDEVLAEAQGLGYAEADPTNDVDGFDTLYKIAILAGIVYGGPADLDQIHREGIRHLDAREFDYARILGYTIRLLGVAEECGPRRVRLRVHPTMVKNDHPLAGVRDVFNALWFHGDFVGDLMFSGRGAGADPTASAVVGDLIDVARNYNLQGSGSAIPYGQSLAMEPMETVESRYYVRLNVLDRPNTLGRIATAFGEHEVGLAEMEMHVVGPDEGEIAFLTHISKEGDFVRSLTAIEELPVVNMVAAWMRVEG